MTEQTLSKRGLDRVSAGESFDKLVEVCKTLRESVSNISELIA